MIKSIITHELVTPALIDNTTMQLNFRDGVPTSYYIIPNEGYVIHDKERDTPEYDEETMQETGNIILGYAKKFVSCSVNYDFEVNPREFYAVREIYVKNK